jgi:hypothetical protein
MTLQEFNLIIDWRMKHSMEREIWFFISKEEYEEKLSEIFPLSTSFTISDLNGNPIKYRDTICIGHFRYGGIEILVADLSKQ